MTYRAVVMFTGSASSWQWLEKHDPRYGRDYEVVGAISSKAGASGCQFARDCGIPVVELDFKEWRTQHNVKLSDLVGRRRYFQLILDKLDRWRKVDFIICSGLMLVITEPFLSTFEGRILNVHPADLTILDAVGEIKYTGLDVVRRAMRAGHPTASTVHIVTKNLDTGPRVAVSNPLPYKPGDDPERHQDRMKEACDGPAYAKAIALLLHGGWPYIPYVESEL